MTMPCSLKNLLRRDTSACNEVDIPTRSTVKPFACCHASKRASRCSTLRKYIPPEERRVSSGSGCRQRGQSRILDVSRFLKSKMKFTNFSYVKNHGLTPLRLPRLLNFVFFWSAQTCLSTPKLESGEGSFAAGKPGARRSPLLFLFAF